MTNNPDPAPQPGARHSWLARLRGAYQSVKPTDAANPDEDSGAAWDAKPAEAPPPEAVAEPAEPVIPLAEPVAAEVEEAPGAVEAVAEEAVPAAAGACPICGAQPSSSQTYCADCGYMFAANPRATMPEFGLPAAVPDAAPELSASSTMLKNCYQLGEQLTERDGVARFRGQKLDGPGGPVPVIILRGPWAEPVVEAALEVVEEADEEIMPSFDLPGAAEPTTLPGEVTWPSPGWEKAILEHAQHPGLPRVLDHFNEGSFEYLVEEVPTGQVLWDAWDDPEATAQQRYTYLRQVAEALQRLHQAGALLESLRPDVVVIADGQARLIELTDILPLPLPPHPPLRASLYTAPELILTPDQADARANLFSFGAMVYSLAVLGRELTEGDFEKQQGTPKPFIPTFPDSHPLFARLMVKTFVREVHNRFPTDEAAKEDPTGFTELIRVLDVCGRTLDNVRMEIAAWTTTGIVRTGNEDAFALLHAVESRQDELTDFALILLADGMGGYEAGEVASALAIQTLRKNLLQHRMFAALAGDNPPQEGIFTVDECKKVILTALKDTNRTIYDAPKKGIGRRGMGCTAEVVYVDGQNVIVGHVGDSRTYHITGGRAIQITRDQTLVNRLVELGQITPEEAETHPRRSELQQAIGGRPEVEPILYHARLKAGDWILVCSDGLSNHVKPDELREMLQLEAGSAEIAARRLVNFVNLRGATDNATVVVVRAT